MPPTSKGSDNNNELLISFPIHSGDLSWFISPAKGRPPSCQLGRVDAPLSSTSSTPSTMEVSFSQGPAGADSPATSKGEGRKRLQALGRALPVFADGVANVATFQRQLIVAAGLSTNKIDIKLIAGDAVRSAYANSSSITWS